jgi:ABC-type multidrug transport system fused ATPase/permease subunit
VREVLRLPREAGDPPDLVCPARLRGEIEFDNVWFSYRDGRGALCGMSFHANAGETIALVGLSGAGKTTAISLISRLYEPVAGRVLVDGIDVRRLRLKDLREQIAVVPQEPVLLSGSIRDNIRYGRLSATDDEVAAAASAAGCEPFIALLPHGIDTALGDLGAGLSGGERQRLSIARALLKDAPILMLDEPTASLDALAEADVLAALSLLRAGRTTVVIAHRLSTVRNADRILVLDGGAIAAQGQHDELLARSDLYCQLCAQLRVAPSENPDGLAARASG